MLDAETVVWTPSTTETDKYGDGTEADGRSRKLQAVVAARSSSESAGSEGPGVLVGESLYILSPRYVPGPSDRILVRGQTYEVVGEAHRWGSAGVEVAIQRTGAKP